MTVFDRLERLEAAVFPKMEQGEVAHEPTRVTIHDRINECILRLERRAKELLVLRDMLPNAVPAEAARVLDELLNDVR
jgi:hypothetical protein